MKASRLSEYRVMWVFVFFDLPTYTSLERKAASGFRQSLLKDGFSMFQYSIYTRHCASAENAAVHVRRVKSMLPDEGEVVIMTITDKQFGMMEHFSSHCTTKPAEAPPPLDLFPDEDIFLL
jgi:CRISPR-associated endoribonuclease cas2